MRRRRKKSDDDEPVVRTPAGEQLLIDAIPELTATRVLCTSLGRGQFAAAFAQSTQRAGPCRPGDAPQVICHFFDLYLAQQAQRFLDSRLAQEDKGRAGGGLIKGVRNLFCVSPADGRNRVAEKVPDTFSETSTSVEIACAADFPVDGFDLVAIPVPTSGDAELTRDVLQAGHLALQTGGRFVAAIRNRDDQWLHAELRKLFPKVTRRPQGQGVVYLATKTAPLKKVKSFACEFAFRDKGRLIKAVSRPGVFSHRSLDAGARALLNAMEVRPGDRVLDIGCGSGAVGLAAALRAENVTVVAVDSQARAIDCTQKGAALNSLTNLTAVLNADGDCGETCTFDLVAGNPPYFSDFRIAEIFLQAARRALKPQGRVLMVTKNATWFEHRMGELFDMVTFHSHKTYTVVAATK